VTPSTPPANCSASVSTGARLPLSRSLALLGGLLLVLSYTLPWVRVTGTTRPSNVDQLGATALSSTPDLVALLGVAVVALSVLRWNHLTQLGVGLSGLTALVLSVRLAVGLSHEGVLVEVGGVVGEAGAFALGVGLWTALCASALAAVTAATALAVSFHRRGRRETLADSAVADGDSRRG